MAIVLASSAQVIGGVVAVIVLWLLPSLLVARLAERKGRSFALWLAFLLLFTWVPLLIAILVLPRRAQAAR